VKKEREMLSPIEIFTSVKFEEFVDEKYEKQWGVIYEGYIGFYKQYTVIADHTPGGIHVDVYRAGFDGYEVVQTFHFDYTELGGNSKHGESE
jgi:hypothetical protein